MKAPKIDPLGAKYDPNLKEVREFFEKQIQDWAGSWAERDGVVRDWHVMKNIRCLQVAIKLLDANKLDSVARRLLVQLETGQIAQHSHRADMRRAKLEKELRNALK
jgi:hypothetical protein